MENIKELKSQAGYFYKMAKPLV